MFACALLMFIVSGLNRTCWLRALRQDAARLARACAFGIDETGEGRDDVALDVLAGAIQC